MFQRIKDHYLRQSLARTRAISVSFTGGLGAQILSAAIYHQLRATGHETFADMRYFSKASRIAQPGNRGEISHWKWELDSYGLGIDSFVDARAAPKRVATLHDGALKFSLAMSALRSPAIRAAFDTANNNACSESYRSNELAGQRYLCLHIRRGDYVNVASHLIDERSFDDLASQFGGLVDSIVILSDSKLKLDQLSRVEKTFHGRIHAIDDNPDPLLAHSLMRNAAVLICSNSQFSLSAGLLSEGVVVIPKKWFGRDADAINAAVDEISEFAVRKP